MFKEEHLSKIVWCNYKFFFKTHMNPFKDCKDVNNCFENLKELVKTNSRKQVLTEFFQNNISVCSNPNEYGLDLKQFNNELDLNNPQLRSNFRYHPNKNPNSLSSIVYNQAEEFHNRLPFMLYRDCTHLFSVVFYLSTVNCLYNQTQLKLNLPPSFTVCGKLVKLDDVLNENTKTLYRNIILDFYHHVN